MPDLSKTPMPADPAEPEDNEIDTDDDGQIAGITCGCGWSVFGRNESNNRYAYEDHVCPNAPVTTTDWGRVVRSAVLYLVVGAVLALIVWVGR
jgi:hypothetical protein